MLKEIKNTLKDLSTHKEELVIEAAIIAAFVGYAMFFYKLGAMNAWPPKEVFTDIIERDGKLFLRINNALYSLKS